MGLIEKLDMLDLKEEEREKAKTKFLATLAIVSDEELRGVVDTLGGEGIRITRAKEIKVLGNTKEDISKKFSILDEIHETGIYQQDPSKINLNVIDIYKKIKFCIQSGRPYKKEDGTYEPFLFNELLWQQEFSKEMKPEAPKVEQTLVEEAPKNVIEPVMTEAPKVEPVIEPIVSEDTIHRDIKDYMLDSNDEAELEAKTTDFATVRKELEASLKELDSLRTLSDDNYDEISFNDLEPESYGMGRAA